MKQFLKLMLVTNRSSAPLEGYLEFVKCCAQAGVTAVQLREKRFSVHELIDFGKKLRLLLHPFSVPLIINDRVDICLEVDGQGVHLGQGDGNVLEARRRLGDHRILGLTVNSLIEVQKANDLPLDYVGLGAIFPTSSKPAVQTIWGLEGLKQASTFSRHPIIAIGGIQEKHVKLVMEAGARGIAAIGMFHEALDPKKTVENLRHIMEAREHVATN